jgi:hypothetical protein
MFFKRRKQPPKSIELTHLAETLKAEAPDLYKQLFEDTEQQEDTKENKEKLSKTLKSLGYGEEDVEALRQEILRQKRGDFSQTTMQILKIIFICIILHALFQLAIVLFSLVPKLPIFFKF